MVDFLPYKGLGVVFTITTRFLQCIILPDELWAALFPIIQILSLRKFLFLELYQVGTKIKDCEYVSMTFYPLNLLDLIIAM